MRLSLLSIIEVYRVEIRRFAVRSDRVAREAPPRDRPRRVVADELQASRDLVTVNAGRTRLLPGAWVEFCALLIMRGPA
jgi:hypothetical protein